MKRLFVAQGSLHLIAAFAAGETTSSGGAVPRPGDVVLIHGLNPEPAQQTAWRSSLETAIARLGSFEAVITLDRPAVRSLELAARRGGWTAAATRLRAILGDATFDELYIQKNAEWFNHLIRATYADARTVCTGDGLGMNYSDSYWLPQGETPRALPPRRGIARFGERVFDGLRRVSGGGAVEPEPPPFSTHCYLLPNLFDDRVDDPVIPELATIERLAERWLGALDRPSFEGDLSEDRETLALVTSCFAEAERCSPEKEIEAYTTRLLELDPERRATWLVQPHPRDRLAKTEALVARLRRENDHVVLHDDPSARYLPFELAVWRQWRGSDAPRRFLTFSSACLGLELLCGEETTVGFGEELVRQTFHPSFVERRLQHERDLLAALETVRTRRAAKEVSS